MHPTHHKGKHTATKSTNTSNQTISKPPQILIPKFKIKTHLTNQNQNTHTQTSQPNTSIIKTNQNIHKYQTIKAITQATPILHTTPSK